MTEQEHQAVAACGIEHLAVLYALFVREAYKYGRAGYKAACDATGRYGRERGARMAQYALAAGDDQSRPNYLLYKEWRPPHAGLMEPGPVQKEPSYATTVLRCEWNESWRRHDLLEYGKLYCRYVDRHLCRGWSEGSDFEGYEVKITTLLSEGDAHCTLDWGYALTPELEERRSVKSAAIGDRYVRNFDYHTGHLLHAVGAELREQLGPARGEAIHVAVLAVFEEKFGSACIQAIRKAFP